MNALAVEHISTEHLESEFIPPIDERETWGMPWEQQLRAVQAWQEAGGNTDGEAGQWAEPSEEVIVPALEDVATAIRNGNSGGSGSGGNALTMRTIVRMNTLLVSLRERLLQMTTEASNIAIAEMSLRQGAATRTTTGVPDVSESRLHPEHARRIAELVRSWFDIIAAAQTSMTALTGLAPKGGMSTASRGAANESYPFVERRHHAVAIEFSDRRLAGRRAG